jgi:bifunctional non-homologous end joining protein LigD
VSEHFPEWVEPMAATLTEQRFAGPEWTFERKFDGIRLLAFKNGREVRLFSRNRLPQTLPAITDALQQLPVRELILDGELTWGSSLVYHVFDLLWLEGQEIMTLRLDDRRARLATLPLAAPLERVVAIDDEQPWERACREGWESRSVAIRSTSIAARSTGSR